MRNLIWMNRTMTELILSSVLCEVTVTWCHGSILNKTWTRSIRSLDCIVFACVVLDRDSFACDIRRIRGCSCLLLKRIHFFFFFRFSTVFLASCAFLVIKGGIFAGRRRFIGCHDELDSVLIC